MIRVVLDTNVLISGILGHGIPAQIIALWQRYFFQVFVSDAIIAEVRRTLQSPYVRRTATPEEIARLWYLLHNFGHWRPITVEVRGVATHPEDDLVLATAVSARADYLITGDRQLQRLGSYEGVTILSPRAFLQLLPPAAE